MAVELQPMAPGGVWLELSASRPPVYVTHPDHAKRLISEGGREVVDPRVKQQEEVTEDVSTPNDVKSNSPNKADDSRQRNSKPAVQ